MTFIRRIAGLFLWLSWIFNLAPAQTRAASPAQAAKIAHPEPTDAFAQARLLLQRGQYDQAIDQLNQLGSQRPALKGLAHELGSAYYRKSDYPRAIESLKKPQEENPQDNEAWK